MRIPAGQFTSFLGLAPSARRTRHRGECSDHLHTIIAAESRARSLSIAEIVGVCCSIPLASVNLKEREIVALSPASGFSFFFFLSFFLFFLFFSFVEIQDCGTSSANDSLMNTDRRSSDEIVGGATCAFPVR